MKFARELEENLVPEWRTRYFEYKQAKKQIKAVAAAARRASLTLHGTPYARPDRQTPILRDSLTPLVPEHQQDPLSTSDRTGSIIASPPSPASRAQSLHLPDPALDPDDPSPPSLTRRATTSDQASVPPGGAYRVGQDSGVLRLHRSRLKTLLSRRSEGSVSGTPWDVPLHHFAEADTRKKQFDAFLHQQLEKIETFYAAKEGEGVARLGALRSQLHLLRDQRHDLQVADATKRSQAHQNFHDHNLEAANGLEPHLPAHKRGLDALSRPFKTAKSAQQSKENRKPDPLATPEFYRKRHPQDYVPQQIPPDVKYSHAKRRLKRALRDYYRSLELLKSYVLLNRTSFRKINKKYDKAIHASPRMEFVLKYVEKAHFVQSDELDNLMTATEDLYSRYFEGGNRKVAVGKLKKRVKTAGSFNEIVFRNGIFLSAAVVLGVQGLVNAADRLLNDSSSVTRQNTSYLLQVSIGRWTEETLETYLVQLYAGYFLMLLLMLLFCLDCRIFDRRRINYVLVFEFDRDYLDWRQLSEVPCILFTLLSLIFFLNFADVGGSAMFLYWPVVLITVSTILLFLPVPILCPSGRKWFLNSCVSSSSF